MTLGRGAIRALFVYMGMEMKLERIDWTKLPPIENSVDMGDTNASCFNKSIDDIEEKYKDVCILKPQK